jgi:hypothetical protein
MATSFADVQECAAEMAKTNAESAFVLVENISKAQTFQDVNSSGAIRSRPTLRERKASEGCFTNSSKQSRERRRRRKLSPSAINFRFVRSARGSALPVGDESGAMTKYEKMPPIHLVRLIRTRRRVFPDMIRRQRLW